MNDADLDKYRQRLLDMKEELLSLQESSKDSTATVELDQASVGRLSRMDAMQGQAMAQASARRRQQQLVAIEGAFRRMESGDFGYCYGCGEPIDSRRLEAMPIITRCVECMG